MGIISTVRDPGFRATAGRLIRHPGLAFEHVLMGEKWTRQEIAVAARIKLGLTWFPQPERLSKFMHEKSRLKLLIARELLRRDEAVCHLGDAPIRIDRFEYTRSISQLYGYINIRALYLGEKRIPFHYDYLTGERYGASFSRAMLEREPDDR